MNHRILNLPISADFNFGECLWFLDRDFDDCMLKVDRDSLTKALLLKEGPVLLNIRADAEQLLVSVLQGDLAVDDEPIVKKYIADWFDIGLDLSPFYALLAKDPRLAFMANAYQGLRLVGIPDMFEAICWAIIGQQINLTFAYKLKRRLVERYGRQLDFGGEAYFLFPEAAVLAEASMEELQGMQFSKSKALYLTLIARAFASKQLSKEGLQQLPDLASRQKALMGIKGVGLWTANYTLMKCLKERSCIPFGDAGLLNALLNHGIIADKKQALEMEGFFAAYPTWESYLVFYLWRSLSKRSEA
ncbi:DNA-3-methyladenine glycosylase II [Pedobacter steynii]|uniref:DNA-3-methyladenine glycosylase II n=1 Tax=Pedobacter steynii TaxID=430522 RepID=A0A1H0MFR8_9SPHI|nr:DNA glycosylase [Pedobacter steynii]NQX43656.1 DNA-3-methyladenine glycosylase 2 family protein [Pedobacter steynii]SDO79259.1 DNA-3-methyladenine glycosylase II [Pedobacter steynii]